MVVKFYTGEMLLGQRSKFSLLNVQLLMKECISNARTNIDLVFSTFQTLITIQKYEN